MDSLFFNFLPSIKNEESVIDVELESPYNLINEWDKEVRVQFQNINRLTWEDSLQMYLKSFKQRIVLYKHAVRLHEKVVVHLKYLLLFHEFHISSLDYMDPSNIYDILEEILVQYCTLELDVAHKIRKRAKNGFIAQRIQHFLDGFFSTRPLHINHVLLKIKCRHKSESCISVTKLLYHHNLITKPVMEYSDTLFCSSYLLMRKYMELLPYTEHVTIEKILCCKHIKSKQAIEESDLMQRITRRKPRDLIDKVMNVINFTNVCISRYFNYLRNSKSLRNMNFDFLQSDHFLEELEETAFGAHATFINNKPDIDARSISSDSVIDLSDDEPEIKVYDVHEKRKFKPFEAAPNTVIDLSSDDDDGDEILKTDLVSMKKVDAMPEPTSTTENSAMEVDNSKITELESVEDTNFIPNEVNVPLPEEPTSTESPSAVDSTQTLSADDLVVTSPQENEEIQQMSSTSLAERDVVNYDDKDKVSANAPSESVNISENVSVKSSQVVEEVSQTELKVSQTAQEVSQTPQEVPQTQKEIVQTQKEVLQTEKDLSLKQKEVLQMDKQLLQKEKQLLQKEKELSQMEKELSQTQKQLSQTQKEALQSVKNNVLADAKRHDENRNINGIISEAKKVNGIKNKQLFPEDSESSDVPKSNNHVLVGEEVSTSKQKSVDVLGQPTPRSDHDRDETFLETWMDLPDVTPRLNPSALLIDHMKTINETLYSDHHRLSEPNNCMELSSNDADDDNISDNFDSAQSTTNDEYCNEIRTEQQETNYSYVSAPPIRDYNNGHVPHRSIYKDPKSGHRKKQKKHLSFSNVIDTVASFHVVAHGSGKDLSTIENEFESFLERTPSSSSRKRKKQESPHTVKRAAKRPHHKVMFSNDALAADVSELTEDQLLDKYDTSTTAATTASKIQDSQSILIKRRDYLSGESGGGGGDATGLHHDGGSSTKGVSPGRIPSTEEALDLPTGFTRSNGSRSPAPSQHWANGDS